jgi:hypothetical protein
MMPRTHLIEVTSQSRATAALQILLPRKPLPPQTTSFRFAVVAAAISLAQTVELCGSVTSMRGSLKNLAIG